MLTSRIPRAIAAFAFFACGALAFAEDEVPIPGGPASVRRLLALDPTRPNAAFFLDVHQPLLDGAPVEVSWNKVAKRQKLIFFAEDLADWRAKFGNPALLSASGREEWKRTERALKWLGFKVSGEGPSFTTEQRDDQESLRRQTFLDALGTPTTSVLARLRAGETVAITSADETAPFPFGIASWREILDAPKLTPTSAFTDLVKDVKASRMLVALHALDPETREGLRGLLPDGKGRPVAWRILYDEALETFARFPEALSMRDGRFLLPGGKESEPVWTDIIGVSPADRAGFLRALYKTDSGKAAYVVEVLHQLPDSAARKLLLGNTARGKAAARRFRRLYEAIEKEGESYELERRVPYDFGHLARFLELSGEGGVWLSGFDLDATEYPRDETELSDLVSRTRQSAGAPEDTLRSLFGSETWKAPRGVSAQQRFLIVSSLLAARPNLDDPGLRLLLYRGADRFLPAYGVLEDIPLEPSQARRYLFTLDRLDRLTESRDAEVRAGLFQVSVDLLAQLTRSGAMTAKESGELLSSLLDLPLFAAEDTTAAQGVEKVYWWLSDGLLSALRTSERRSIESALNEQAAREQAYREALRARDERIEARRLEARALDEFHRLEAEDRLRFLLDTFCLENDEAIGPHPPRLLRVAEELRRDAGDAANSWMQEALAIEQLRAALPASAAELPRVSGVLPGTSAILDAAEPLPEYLAVEVPEESGSPDELLTRALVGSPPPALFDWRGGRYRFDSSTDEIARRTAFRENQKLASLSDLESLHAGRDALLAASAKGDLAGAKSAAGDFATGLDPEPARTGSGKRTEDARLARQNEQARDAAEHLARMSNAKHLSRVPERLHPLDTVLAERHLEATLGHVYAASAGDPNDIYFQDPYFVRRHAFRHAVARGRSSSSPFSQTALVPAGDGQGSRIAGSVFGLPDILGVLHSDQLPRPSGSSPQNQDIRSGLMAPVRRMSGVLLDDDALEFVAASCSAAEELARALCERTAQERSRSWNDVARDLVPGYRLALVAGLEGAVTPELLSQYLSPSDLYRIGRRLALSEKSAVSGGQLPSAARARDALSRLRERLGEDGARERLAQFGPRASHYAGRFRLTDLDLPAYERLAAYRTPQLLSDRLYDLKIAVACSVSDAGFPAAVLPLILPAALDEMIANLKMAYGSDWSSTIRRAQAFTRADLDRHLAQALETGRLARDIAADEQASAE